MFNHIMIGSNDIERSKRFYDAVLATLGAGEPVRNTAATGHARLSGDGRRLERRLRGCGGPDRGGGLDLRGDR